MIVKPPNAESSLDTNSKYKKNGTVLLNASSQLLCLYLTTKEITVTNAKLLGKCKKN